MRRLNRIVILIIIDVILVNLALFFSLWLRFDGQIPAFYLQSYRLFFASTFSLFLQTPSAAATQGNLRVIFH